MTELGVYVLSHEATGLYYIGSTSNFPQRLAAHKSRLKAGIHHVVALQAVYNTEPKLAVTFHPFDELEEAQKEEKRLIEFFGEDSNCVNNLHTGRPQSEITRAKIGEANKRKILGITRSPETRAKISLARIGVKHTEETKRKVSIANTGRKHIRTKEYREKISKALMKRVCINGVVYNSTGDAAAAHGCAQSTVMWRIKNNSIKFIDWQMSE